MPPPVSNRPASGVFGAARPELQAACRADPPLDLLAPLDLPPLPGKIALVTRSGGGGVARHILDLLDLQRRGVARFHGVFTVLSESFRRRLRPFEADGFTWDELPMRRTPAPFRDLRDLRRLTDLLRRADVRLVHSHGTKGGCLGRLAARELGLPAIHTPHTFPMEIHSLWRGLLRPALTVLERSLARHAAALVLLTENQRQLAQGWRFEPGRMALIANGVSSAAAPDWIAAERRRIRAALNIPDAAPLAVWVGRFDPQKNPGLLLLTAVRFLTALPDARMLFVGAEGESAADDCAADAAAVALPASTSPRSEISAAPRRESFGAPHLGAGAVLQRRLAEAGLGDRALFTGERDDVDALLCAGDLFLNASRYEGMPYVVLEALRAGLPQVLTDIPAHRALIADGVEGILAPPDSAALADALTALWTAPERRAAMRDAARRRAGCYGREQFLAAHAKLYREVFAAR